MESTGFRKFKAAGAGTYTDALYLLKAMGSGAHTLTEISEEWRVHYALFARSGFTPAAVAEMKKVQESLIDLKQIDAVLGLTNFEVKIVL